MAVAGDDGRRVAPHRVVGVGEPARRTTRTARLTTTHHASAGAARLPSRHAARSGRAAHGLARGRLCWADGDVGRRAHGAQQAVRGGDSDRALVSVPLGPGGGAAESRRTRRTSRPPPRAVCVRACGEPAARDAQRTAAAWQRREGPRAAASEQASAQQPCTWCGEPAARAAHSRRGVRPAPAGSAAPVLCCIAGRKLLMYRQC